jgi:Arc/MetJ family transcription regulator
MKKTLNIDEELLKEAKQACGAITDTEAVHKGLEALVRHAALQRMRAYLGTETNAVDVPRRREKPVTKRRTN